MSRLIGSAHRAGDNSMAGRSLSPSTPASPNGVTVRTRRSHRITDMVPGIEALSTSGRRFVLDGELVAGAGRASDFSAVLPRVRSRGHTGVSPVSVSFWALSWESRRSARTRQQFPAYRPAHHHLASDERPTGFQRTRQKLHHLAAGLLWSAVSPAIA
jgi:hypothetical protein